MAAQLGIDGLHDILAGIRGRVEEAETLRRIPDASVADLKRIGFMRQLQPKRWGGLEVEPVAFYESVLAVAEACGSTGWVAGVVGVHPYQVALFDEEVQAEVWSNDPDMWVSSSYMPGGKLTPVDGGYRLSGRWSFSSGSDHCGWVILGTPLADGTGELVEMRNAIVPRSDYRVDDVWRTVGLRGTGSNDIVIDDVFVPERRTLTVGQLFAGGAPGLQVNTGPLYKMPFAAMFANVITGPIIGMAENMLAEGLAWSKQRVSSNWGKTLETDPYTIAALGEAAREIDACRLQLMRNMSDMYQTAVRGDEITMDQRSRARRDQVLGTQRAVTWIDDIFDRTGAAAINEKNPMQRIWRNAHAAKHHTANTHERTLNSWTHNAMGLGPTEIMV